MSALSTDIFDAFVDTLFVDSHDPAVGAGHDPLILGESVFDTFGTDTAKGSLGLLASIPPAFDASPLDAVDIHSLVIGSVFSTPAMPDDDPMFVSLDAIAPQTQWSLLFTEEEVSAPAPVAPSPVIQAPARADSPSKRDHRGVTKYTRKPRAQPLTPILMTPDMAKDPLAVKRARNTEAARRLRARKMERMGELEERCDMLEAKNKALESEVERLRALLTTNGIAFDV